MDPQIFVNLVGPFLSLVVGIVFLAIGGAVARLGSGDFKDAIAIHKTPATPIRSARQGELVKLHGVVVAGETLARSPLTGRAGVLCLTVAGISMNDSTSDTDLTKQRCEFWLDDGSGLRARIRPEGASMVVTPDRLSDDTRSLVTVGANAIGRVTNEQREWARGCLGRKANFDYLEEYLIQAGQQLSIRGRVSWEGQCPGVQASHEGEFTLVAMPLETVRQGQRTRQMMGWGLGGVGLVLMLGAVVWGIVAVL